MNVSHFVLQGVVYFDSGVLGWRPVVGAWLATRSPNEAQCLNKYFGQIMDQVVDFVLQKAGYIIIARVFNACPVYWMLTGRVCTAGLDQFAVRLDCWKRVWLI